MRKRASLILTALLFFTLSIESDLQRTFAQSRKVPAPADVLGFTPGDDRKLASWAKVVEYFQKLAAASDRVKFEEIGKTTMGAPFVYVTISSPENLKRLSEFKEIQRQLADPRILGSPANPAIADRKARDLIARGKNRRRDHLRHSFNRSRLISLEHADRLSPRFIKRSDVQEILRNTIILLVAFDES